MTLNLKNLPVGDINRHQQKTVKVNLGPNHHVLNSRTSLTRRAIL